MNSLQFFARKPAPFPTSPSRDGPNNSVPGTRETKKKRTLLGGPHVVHPSSGGTIYTGRAVRATTVQPTRTAADASELAW